MSTGQDMQVLQLMAGSAAGGAETFFVNLGCAFQRAGCHWRYVLRPHASRERRLGDAHVAYETAPFGKLFDFKTRRTIAKAAAECKPDIVMTWMNRAASFCPDGEFVRVARFGGYYDPKYYRRHDHAVANTRGLAEWLAFNGWAKERVHYIPNFCEVKDEPPTPRATLDTPEDVPLLLALGRLHTAKALDVLLHAMADIPGAHLWIAGDGPLEQELKTLCGSLGLDGRVRFLGWRADRSALLRAADICVFPSRIEPFGNVIIDAWAHGTPLIAAASAGPRETVRPNIDAILVPVDDASALAAAVRDLIGNKEKAAALAAAGAERCESEFSEGKVVGAYVDLFERLARQR